MTPTLPHAGLSLYIGLLPKTWVFYGGSEILRAVADARSLAVAGYKLQLAEK